MSTINRNHPQISELNEVVRYRLNGKSFIRADKDIHKRLAYTMFKTFTTLFPLKITTSLKFIHIKYL